MGKRRSSKEIEEFDAQANATNRCLELGNGRTVELPLREVEDRNEHGGFQRVKLPDFKGWDQCMRCDGYPDADGNPHGGWLPSFVRRREIWYSSLAACPDCVFGAYRKAVHKSAIWHAQLDVVSSSDLRSLWDSLPQVETMDEAAAKVRIDSIRWRLQSSIERLQDRERHRAPAGATF